MLPRCPDELPVELRSYLIAFAEGWARHRCRPTPRSDVTAAWDDLIVAWSDDEGLPLFVRKASENRGREVRHPSGRSFVVVDNSPAQWAFALACGGTTLSLRDIREALAKDQIPIAMILKTVEKGHAKYRRQLGTSGTDVAGWKLGHITPVGLGKVGCLEDVPLPLLKAHFRSLMSPSNMFVIPKAWAGIAEIDEVLEAIKRRL